MKLVDKSRLRRLFDSFLFVDRLIIRQKIRKYEHKFRGKLLDVGCGESPYRGLFSRIKSYIGMDRQGQVGIKHDLNNHPYPIPSESYEGILCTQVLDDIEEPQEFLKELWRILKPGGLMLLTVSFVWELHDEPKDFWRPTKYGLELWMKQAGFKIESMEEIGNMIMTLAMIDIRTIMNLIGWKRQFWYYLLIPYSLGAYCLGRLADNERLRRLPLGYLVVAKKKR